MIPIMEAFYSIQGEGLRAGTGSVFVRTALCNFRCSGFGVKYETGDSIKCGCDSYYAVDPFFKKDWEYYDSYEEIIDLIDSKIPVFSRHNLFKPDIVFTGGEPLLYWKDENYQKVLAHYITRGHKVTIETNAALSIQFTRKYQREIMFSMSVKLTGSGEEKHKRVNIENITNIIENTSDSYLKFVTAEASWDEDYTEIKNILKDTPVYINDVYLMPMGDTIEKLTTNAKFVFDKARELGFKYSDRLHIRVFNNEVGV